MKLPDDRSEYPSQREDSLRRRLREGIVIAVIRAGGSLPFQAVDLMVDYIVDGTYPEQVNDGAQS